MKKQILLVVGFFSLLAAGAAKASDETKVALDCGPSERVVVSIDGEGRPTQLYLKSFSVEDVFAVTNFDEQTSVFLAKPSTTPSDLIVRGSLRVNPSTGKIHFSIQGIPFEFVRFLTCEVSRGAI